MTSRVETPVRLLVVDDDHDLCAVMQSVLEDEGYSVEAAVDGLAAIGAAARHQPELVVLDIMLPGASGPEVARRLRQEHGPGLPILAVTADGSAARKAREVGAYAYLRKPFELRDFLDVVRRGLDEYT
jgi:two-component system response regulator ResD